ncbi:hypothetical protein [Actinomadura rugatobispora]|uniref:DUF1440 domain-containing protein n=1 Tax=Actinomadura rugatobispora TaxID=1994 RepID=A0ABW0ZXQ6_9ACTN|nr:hypothetical protein GCM10010200_077780 [Actinomadura rugatobispora]
MHASQHAGRARAVARAGARGLVAAMAMTGARTVTAAAGPHQKSPPEAIVAEHAPEWFQRLPDRQREALTEIAHWFYGTGGGVVFGLLPERVRFHVLAGPAYGLVIWLGYELAIAPVLGTGPARHRRVTWRTAVAIDHVLYGVVVAGRLAPEPARRRPGSGSSRRTRRR